MLVPVSLSAIMQSDALLNAFETFTIMKVCHFDIMLMAFPVVHYSNTFAKIENSSLNLFYLNKIFMQNKMKLS